MARASKVFETFAEAVSDIPDGATICIAGFGSAGNPYNLMEALEKTNSAKNLTLIANGSGISSEPRPADLGKIVEQGRVKKIICAFTAPTRASQKLPITPFILSGELEAELVPQGTLAERLRAAGAGIPAFYTPTAVGTELAEGRETRMIDGREYLLEYALHVDYAFCRAQYADEFGNLRFTRSQRNFNPIMAMAAKTTIVEIEGKIVKTGEIDPDDVHTPGIFVQRLIQLKADSFYHPAPRETFK